jgi:hypothetical protein
MSDKSFAEHVGVHLGVLAGYVVFTGLVTTEAYYAVFGIRYQTLQFPAAHIVYRGLTILPAAPSLLIPLLLALVWLVIGDRRYSAPNPRPLGATLAMYVAAVLIVLVTYRLAWASGVDAGQQDALSSSSTLPRIEALAIDKVEFPPKRGDAILWLDGDELIAFTPLENLTSLPILKRISRSDIHGLATTSD